jgi:hypothetical protein
LPTHDGLPPLGRRQHEMLLRLDDDLYLRLRNRAKAEGTALSEVVRQAIAAHLRGPDNPPVSEVARP